MRPKPGPKTQGPNARDPKTENREESVLLCRMASVDHNVMLQREKPPIHPPKTPENRCINPNRVSQNKNPGMNYPVNTWMPLGSVTNPPPPPEGGRGMALGGRGIGMFRGGGGMGTPFGAGT